MPLTVLRTFFLCFLCLLYSVSNSYFIRNIEPLYIASRLMHSAFHFLIPYFLLPLPYFFSGCRLFAKAISFINPSAQVAISSFCASLSFAFWWIMV